jgi:pyrroline-5-carboxylate reductase
MLTQATFAFIGGGNMASALIGGLLKRNVPPHAIQAVDPFAEARQRLSNEFGIATADAPHAGLRDANVVVLAVKPQQFRDACAALAPHLGDSLVISVAAGIRLTDLSRWLNGHARVVRAMPNTPALAGMGMTGLTAPTTLPAADRALASALADAVGTSVWVKDDAQIDAVTALSGSGPAYVFYFIEAMERAATELGLSSEQGRALAVQTFIGAATLAGESTESVQTLRERVTSKGGTTYAALTAMEQAGMGNAFVKAMHAAAARGKEMGEEFGRQ